MDPLIFRRFRPPVERDGAVIFPLERDGALLPRRRRCTLLSASVLLDFGRILSFFFSVICSRSCFLRFFSHPRISSNAFRSASISCSRRSLLVEPASPLDELVFLVFSI